MTVFIGWLLIFFVFILNMSVTWSSSEPAVAIFGVMVRISFDWNKIKFRTLIKSPNGTPIYFVGNNNSLSDVKTLSNSYKDRVNFTGDYSKKNFSFTLKNVGKEDAGQFYCQQGTEPPIPDCGETLIVLDKPSQPEITLSPPVAVVGKSLTLTCTSSSNSIPVNHNLTMFFTWYTDGKVIDNIKYNESLTVMKVAKDDDKRKYKCEAADGKTFAERGPSAKSESKTIEVEYAPEKQKFTPGRKMQSVKEGGILNVTCSALCKPKCKLEWRRNNLTVGNNGTLVMEKISRDKDGQYRCYASNKHGQKKKKLTVDVQYKPNVTNIGINSKSEREVETKENEAAIFFCDVDSNPAPVVYWYFGNKTNSVHMENLTSQSRQKEHNYTSYYKISAAKCSDYSFCYTEAINTVGESERCARVKLKVRCSPRADGTFKTMYAGDTGQLHNVWLSVLAYPQPNVTKWYRIGWGEHQQVVDQNRSDVKINKTDSRENYVKFQLQLRKLQELDFGTYGIEVTNEEGNKTFQYTLSPIGPPEPSTGLNVSKIHTSTVTLNWKPGFDKDAQQYFVVDCRVGEDGEWINWIENIHGPPAVISGLRENTLYHFRVRAINKHGESKPSSSVKVKTKVPVSPADANMGIIIGIIIVTIFIISLIAGIIFFLYRRRKQVQDKGAEAESSRTVFLPERSGQGNQNGGQENVYENSLLPNPKPVMLKNPYYVTVNESSRQDETKPLIDNSSGASPYEEVTLENNNAKYSCTKNSDGLTYIELEFPLKREPNQKLVIHSKEPPTHYETIDFTRKAPPEEKSIELDEDDEIIEAK